MAIWSTLIGGSLALSFAAYFAKRASSKALALGFLAVLLCSIWSLLAFALADLSAHELPETVANWPSPLLLALAGLLYFSAVATAAFLRKQD